MGTHTPLEHFWLRVQRVVALAVVAPVGQVHAAVALGAEHNVGLLGGSAALDGADGRALAVVAVLGGGALVSAAAACVGVGEEEMERGQVSKEQAEKGRQQTTHTNVRTVLAVLLDVLALLRVGAPHHGGVVGARTIALALVADLVAHTLACARAAVTYDGLGL